MLDMSLLTSRLTTYWDEMQRCRQSGAFWSLLHVTVCVPDICAALESVNGETNKQRYISWCNRHFAEPMLTGAERYRMRCKVLHQGRATADQPGRYSRYSFGSPSSQGNIDHLRVESSTLHLDVGEMASESQQAARMWIDSLAASPSSTRALAVEMNLNSLVRVEAVQVRQAGVLFSPAFIINKTN
jgi:hypothetical protein